MPTNYNENTPRDPNIAKQLNKLYRNSSAPESNTYQASRKKLENSFRAEPSARPAPQVNRQPFTENIHSRSRPKGYEDKATEARQQARREYLQRTGQIQEIARGARNPSNFTPKASPTTVVNFPMNTPRPAIPGAGLASGVASLGLGFLIDRYATPYLMDKAQRAGGFLGANLAYKRGKISEVELEAALSTIRNGNPTKWGNRINEIRRIQKAALAGKKAIQLEQIIREFSGGQEYGILYNLTLEKYVPGEAISQYTRQYQGRIIGINLRIEIIEEFSEYFQHRYTFQTETQDAQGNLSYEFELASSYTSTAQAQGFPPPSIKIINAVRADGKPDPIETAKSREALIIPTTLFQPISSKTPPLIDKPPEINKAKSNIIIIPAGFPIGVSGSDKTVQVTPSTTSPSTIEIPHPRTQEPTNPDEEKKVPPLTISNPNSPDIKLETSGSGPVTINIPGYHPITVTPGTNKPQGALPIQDVNRQYQPVASTATPTKPGTTPTTTPTPTTTKPATTEDLDQFKKDLERLINTGAILAGLTPAIQTIGDRVAKIGENTTPESITTAAAAGTCRTVQPGGCTTRALDDAVGRVNQNSNNNANALGAANALANTAQIGMLEDITRRIGNQLPGGLAGKLSRFVNWSVADRVTGLVTMFSSLHNTMMLTNSVKETFLDVLDNLLNTGYNLVPNLFKKADEDAAIDSREYIGGAINTFFGGLFGVTEWTALQQQWKAYSTIYASSTNAYDNLRSIHSDTQELLNRQRKDIGELGNALVDEGLISEDNWEYRDTDKRVKSKSLMKLERMNQGLEEFDNKLQALEQVTQLVLNITNTAKEIKENADEIGKAFKDADRAATLDRNARVEGLEVPNFNLIDFLDGD